MLPSLDDRRRLQEGPPRSCNDLEESLQSELELILHAQRQRSRQVLDRERDLNIYRSGSAPPTVEGSFSAVGSLFRSANNNNNNNNFGGTGSSCISGGGGNTGSGNNSVLSEDELRSHPAYLSYYYSNDNINPRLPPPLLSKEDWRVAQRFQAAGGSYFGGIGDLRRRNEFVDEGGNSSLFSTQPAVLIQKAESDLDELRNAIRSNNLSKQSSVEWLDRGSDGLIGLQRPSLGSRRKSFADIVQEGLDQPVSLSGHLSRPASGNAIGVPELHAAAALSNGLESMDGLHSTAAPPGFSEFQSHGSSISPSLAMGSSLSRSTTPEQHLIGRAPGSALPPVGSRVGPEKNSMMTLQNGHSSGMSELDEIAAALSGLSMSKIRHADQESHLQAQLSVSMENQPDFLLKTTNGQTLQQHLMDRSSAQDFPFSSNCIDVARKNGVMPNLNALNMGSNGEISIPKRTSSSANLHSKMNRSGLPSLERLDICHQNASIPSMDFTGRAGPYAVNQKPHPAIKNYLEEGGSGIEHDFNRLRNQLGSNPQSPITDQQYSQYLQKTSDFARGASASHFRNSFGTSNGDLDMIQKAYVEGLLAQQKQHYELPLLGKSHGPGQGYYRNPSHSLHMPYPGNSMENCMLPSVGSGSFQNERVPRFSSVPRSSLGASIGLFQSDATNDVERRYTSSLLDEFKNNKTKSFELTDIADHVVEFSTDQFGSRFIQQKLETATVEGKNKIFPEIIPHARTLMTDVFGNYVIQKFFEHGTESQRRELASQLTGHVLPLSLQMYGCRVIQKALEVVDVGQQTQMVTELDGSIMKCVRDQNGNHVIQKCIECVPEDRIQFIISSFYGQVVPLSTHPYGCRVIQRVLEHCHDMKTQQIIMDEILQSVCTLAQDQYGNYVIQHVLEHGKLHERSAIISKLAGQIIKMSQQKFASNVVEKCLTFGGPEERQLLVDEMLGSTDENEPLQAMMKDPFGNYVVQKVLETCDDQSLELILSRIKVHLNTLKRYTYGKHIVSRVEKLIAAGERRIGLSSSLSS